jgi:Family of unknown function (DUF5412)
MDAGRRDRSSCMKKHSLIIIAIMVMSGCTLYAECSEAIFDQAKSPDGKYVANLFQRNCGATTSLIYHVNLRKSSEQISYDSYGRVTDGQIFLIRNQVLSVTWRDEKTLVIKCNNCLTEDKPSIYQKTWENINILFESDSNSH